jgi:hypothetical protein
MSQTELFDCPVCYENKERKELFSLKCCGNFICKSCEPLVRETHSKTLPSHDDRFIRCPLCREMEAVPFSLATRLIDRSIPRNFQELSFEMSPNFDYTPAEQDRRDGNELRQLIIQQQTRRALEVSHREQRIQEERQRLQRQERDIIEAFLEEMEEAIQ